LPRWLSILHDDKYHEFLRFRGWVSSSRGCGAACRSPMYRRAASRDGVQFWTDSVRAMWKGGGIAPPGQWPPGWTGSTPATRRTTSVR